MAGMMDDLKVATKDYLKAGRWACWACSWVDPWDP
jgi:hypothetical protein